MAMRGADGLSETTLGENTRPRAAKYISIFPDAVLTVNLIRRRTSPSKRQRVPCPILPHWVALWPSPSLIPTAPAIFFTIGVSSSQPPTVAVVTHRNTV